MGLRVSRELPLPLMAINWLMRYPRDNHQRLCFTMALWNGKDPILKERLYGLNGSQGGLIPIRFSC